jgi:hypothetical protein
MARNHLILSLITVLILTLATLGHAMLEQDDNHDVAQHDAVSPAGELESPILDPRTNSCSECTWCAKNCNCTKTAKTMPAKCKSCCSACRGTLTTVRTRTKTSCSQQGDSTITATVTQIESTLIVDRTTVTEQAVVTSVRTRPVLTFEQPPPVTETQTIVESGTTRTFVVTRSIDLIVTETSYYSTETVTKTQSMFKVTTRTISGRPVISTIPITVTTDGPVLTTIDTNPQRARDVTLTILNSTVLTQSRPCFLQTVETGTTTIIYGEVHTTTVGTSKSFSTVTQVVSSTVTR